MTICSKCETPHNRNGRYCRKCHNLLMRQYRKERVKKVEAMRRALKGPAAGLRAAVLAFLGDQ